VAHFTSQTIISVASKAWISRLRNVSPAHYLLFPNAEISLVVMTTGHRRVRRLVGDDDV